MKDSPQKIRHTTGETYECDREFERKRRANVCNNANVEDSPHNGDRLGSGGRGGWVGRVGVRGVEGGGLGSGGWSRGVGSEGVGLRGWCRVGWGRGLGSGDWCRGVGSEGVGVRGLPEDSPHGRFATEDSPLWGS